MVEIVDDIKKELKKNKIYMLYRICSPKWKQIS